MLAYIVLVHKNMKQVVRLIRSLVPDRNVILIHVDIRVKDAQYDFIKSELREYSNVLFVERRKCNWGKFDLVSVTLDSMCLLQNISTGNCRE